ncbi:unnamed protein product [Nesidiocoris tenuis]|uniref:Uncharacterized protein n=1 Tax=Nesidiocoris tenuis TaxID=355587 RepID=A0A6H5GTV1_9HEMI|nr:unnamed protein product [Nesidiocoris tenuis]CAB0006834.1 unnamed protein product [Nesidiocoris tenuis]
MNLDQFCSRIINITNSDQLFTQISSELGSALNTDQYHGHGSILCTIINSGVGSVHLY